MKFVNICRLHLTLFGHYFLLYYYFIYSILLQRRLKRKDTENISFFLCVFSVQCPHWPLFTQQQNDDCIFCVHENLSNFEQNLWFQQQRAQMVLIADYRSHSMHIVWTIVRDQNEFLVAAVESTNSAQNFLKFLWSWKRFSWFCWWTIFTIHSSVLYNSKTT